MTHVALDEAEIEKIIIQLFCLGDIKYIKLFSNLLNKRSCQLILKSMLCSQLPSIFVPNKCITSSIKYRWIISRFLLSENYYEIPFFNYDSLIDDEFQATTDKPTQIFKSSLSKIENKNVEDSKLIQLAGGFLQFNQKRRPMADFLLKTYSPFFTKFPIIRLLQNFQFQCFNLFTDVQNIEVPLCRFSYNNGSSFEELFQIYRGWQKGSFMQQIQNMTIDDRLYPESFGNDTDSKIRSLVDSSIDKKVHFVDIIKNHSYISFLEEKFEDSIERARRIEGIEYWMLLSHVPKNATEFFKKADLPIIENDSIAADFLNRLRNDNSFLISLRQNTGQAISGNDLLLHSIPFILKAFLRSNDPLPFKELGETHFFCLSDRERQIDADFVWSYFALNVAITVLDDPDEAEEKIAQSEWYLTQINNPTVLQNVLIDIFSIMFLQDKGKGRFICHQVVAELVLTTILNCSDDTELISRAQNGHLLIQVARNISGGMNFNDLIFPKREQLFKALQRNDWLIADHIASLNTSLTDLNLLYRTVNDFSKIFFRKKSSLSSFSDSNLFLKSKNETDEGNAVFDPTKSKSKIAIVEIGLSFNDQIGSLQASLKNYSNSISNDNAGNKTGEIKAIPKEVLDLIEKRMSLLTKFRLKNENEMNGKAKAKTQISYNHFNIIKYVNNEALSNVQRSFTRLSATTWCPLAPQSYKVDKEKPKIILSSELKERNLFKSFLRYIDDYLTIVLNDEKICETVFDALRIDSNDVISQLYNKERNKSAEKISNIMKRDFLTTLISSSDKNSHSISEKSIISMAKEEPAVAVALLFMNECKKGTNSGKYNGVNPIQSKISVLHKIADLTIRQKISTDNDEIQRRKQINIIMGIKTDFPVKGTRIDDVNNNRLKNEIKIMLQSINTFNLERMIEISYNLTTNDFSSIVFDFMVLLNNYESFNIIHEIVNNCASVDPVLFDCVIFLRKLSMESINNQDKVETRGPGIFPLQNLFISLLNEHRFSNAKKFVHFFGNKIALDQILIEAYANENSDLIRSEILAVSPCDKTKIESAAYLHPSSKTTYDQAVSSASTSVFTNSLEINNLENIESFINDNPKIDLDEEIISLLKKDFYFPQNSINDFASNYSHKDANLNSDCIFSNFCRFLHKSISLLKKTDQLTKIVFPVFISNISCLSIKSVTDENFAWSLLHRIKSVAKALLLFNEKSTLINANSKNFNQRINEDNEITNFYRQIDILSTLLDMQPYQILGIEYSFADFGANLSHILSKIDKIETFIEYSIKFNVDIQKEFDIYIFKLAQMGISWNNVADIDRFKNSRELFYRLKSLLNYNHFIEPSIIPVFEKYFPPTDAMINIDWPSYIPNDADADADDISTNNKNCNDTSKPTPSKSTPSLSSDTFGGKLTKGKGTSNQFVFTSSVSNSQINERVSPQKGIQVPKSFLSEKYSENDSQNHLYERIIDLANQKTKPDPDKVSMAKLLEFFKDNAPIDLVISYFSENGDFVSAVEKLNNYISNKTLSINNKNEAENCSLKNEKNNLFKESIFEKALSRDMHSTLLKKVKGEEEMFSSILPFSGPYLKFDLYSYLKMWYQAYEETISLFCERQKDPNEISEVRVLNLLSRAQLCLEEYTGNDQTEKDIEIKKLQIVLQRQFCSFTFELNLKCNFSEMNFFQSDNQREQIIIFLLNNLNMKLAVSAIKFFEISTISVGEKLCDILINEDPEKVTHFIQKLEKDTENKIFREILYSMITRTVFVHEDSENVKKYINVLTDFNFKALMNVQFGFIEEACQIAFDENKKDLIALIANEAYKQQKMALMAKCIKYLEK